jgi:hypothetical protein
MGHAAPCSARGSAAEKRRPPRVWLGAREPGPPRRATPRKASVGDLRRPPSDAAAEAHHHDMLRTLDSRRPRRRRAVFPSGAPPRLVQPDGRQLSRSRSAPTAAVARRREPPRRGAGGVEPGLRLQAPPFGSPLSLRRLHRVDVDRASQCFEAAQSVSDPPSRSGARRRHRSEAGRSCGNLIVQPALPSSRTRQRSWVGGS